VRSAFQLTGCPQIGPKPQTENVDSFKNSFDRTSSFWSIFRAYGIPLRIAPPVLLQIAFCTLKKTDWPKFDRFKFLV
jgi:hypothetical protein